MWRNEGRVRMKAAIVLIGCLVLMLLQPVGVSSLLGGREASAVSANSVVAERSLAATDDEGSILGPSGPPPLLQGGIVDSWTETNTPIVQANTSTARWHPAMATLPSGDVLLFGGTHGSGALGDTWLYNTATGSWSQVSTSPTPPARVGHALAALPSGVLLFGGYDGSNSLSDTWRFDSAANTWHLLTFTTSTPTARYSHAMAALPSGDVLLFGGYGPLSDTWRFDSATNSWSQVSTSPTPPGRWLHAMAATPTGALLFGGWDGHTNFNDTWRFDPTANSWSQVSTSTAPPARYCHAMAALPSGNVLLFGGAGSLLNDTWLYNTAAGSWSQVSTSPTPPARYDHAMAATPLGALLFGGGSFFKPFNDTWLYGPAAAPPTVTYTLQPNWNMISLPLTPASTDPQVVFGGLPSPWYLFQWDPLAGIYIGKESINLNLGVGYWLKVPSAVEYSVTGQPNGAAQTGINLGLNWNLIGVPYQGTIPWGAVRISRYGGALVTLDVAIASNWIQGMFFHWNGSMYDVLTSGGSFQSQFGYWAKAKVTGLQLVFLQL